MIIIIIKKVEVFLSLKMRSNSALTVVKKWSWNKLVWVAAPPPPSPLHTYPPV